MTVSRSAEPDVHLRIDLQGVILHYAAHPEAAYRLIEDQRIHHYIDSVSVVPGDGSGLPRLPCEQLYLAP
ncbi:hypothetical protein [Nocardia sp. NBC_01009]|uniref:hypothetical protein n=1 Tax=Nocardia sp. NBC_01009 TaxID=2975996 RepID=UPI00386EDB77|nr:hypothetical protein OHA42_19540 [Nocardia sp. NBC_01009]